MVRPAAETLPGEFVFRRNRDYSFAVLWMADAKSKFAPETVPMLNLCAQFAALREEISAVLREELPA